MNGVTILAKSEGETQTLILDENTTLELPVDAPKPSYDNSYYMNSEDGVEYVFVKSSEGEGTVTYILKEKALATFVPKTSITLSSTLVYNVLLNNVIRLLVHKLLIQLYLLMEAHYLQRK